MGAHLHGLFSAACDDALGGGERARFDAHLAGCAECAAAYETYRRSVEAVRGLPAARLPVAVVLPASSPAMEPPRRWWLAVPVSPRRVAGGAAVALVAAGVAAGVVAGLHRAGSTGPSSAAAPLNLTAGAGRTASSRCPAAAATPAAAAAAPASAPAQFGYRVAAVSSALPQAQLTLAIGSDHYAAGTTVPVYARLALPAEINAAGGQAPSGGAALSVAAPLCVVLEEVSLPQPQSRALAPVAPQALTAPLVLGTAAPTAAAGSARSLHGAAVAGQSTSSPQDTSLAETPLQYVTIPAGLPPGTVLRLVASIPGPGGGAPIEAVLTITVS